MKKPRQTSLDATELRRRAEARLNAQRATPDLAQTEADRQRLVQELQVHQIELEMQNEELQQARVAMEAGLEKYSDLYDFAPVSYLTLDREGTIVEANLAAASLLGTERSRLVGQRFGEFVDATDRSSFRALLDKVFASGTRGFCEITLAHGKMSPIAARIEVAMGAAGIGFRVVLVDLTTHKRAEEDRLILNKLESTGILAGGIAHDFNNLLMIILLDIERVQEMAGAGEGSTLPLEEARKAALSARDLTQQLLTFAKGGTTMREPVLLQGIIRDSVSLPLSGSRVRCELSLAENLWTVEVDEGQIGQVIRNLILNAREAMPDGGVIFVRAENLVVEDDGNSSLPPGDYVRVSVADGGTGMPEEVRAKIFDPYYSTKRRGAEKGTGLGLTICHGIVQKHHGAIEVTSRDGEGTTFNIDLPASRTRPGKRKGFQAPKQVPAGRILVMDDEEPVRRMMGLLLRRMGHEVELVAEGQRAIEVYRNAMGERCPFHLVLLDLTVRDGLGGRETMEALRKLDPQVKGIVMSGYSENSAMREPDRHGFIGVLVKPFESVELREIIARVMKTEVDCKAAS